MEIQPVISRSPEQEKAHALGRQRIHAAVRKLAELGGMSANPVDLRFVIECQQTTIDTLLQLMLQAGACTVEKVTVLDLAYLQARADQLERRVVAALDGQKEMPA